MISSTSPRHWYVPVPSIGSENVGKSEGSRGRRVSSPSSSTQILTCDLLPDSDIEIVSSSAVHVPGSSTLCGRSFSKNVLVVQETCMEVA